MQKSVWKKLEATTDADTVVLLPFLPARCSLFADTGGCLCPQSLSLKIIAEKQGYYIKKHYLCVAHTSYGLTQIINPLKTI